MHRTSRRLISSLLVVFALLSASAGYPADDLTVRYIANEGFLVEGAGRRVLVDALFGGGIPGYDAAPEDLRRALESGSGAWGEIDVALATHFHPDHFDAEAVGRFLSASPEAWFVSTPQAVARLRETLAATPRLLDRVRAVLPAGGEIDSLRLRGVGIDVLNLTHGSGTNAENIGLVVTLGEKDFLHFGDTEAKMPDFEPYLERLQGTHLAILPFWFLSSEWRAEMVRDLIEPDWVVIGHTPTPDAPAGYFARWRGYDELVAGMLAAFPEAHLPSEPGQTFRLGGE